MIYIRGPSRKLLSAHAPKNGWLFVRRVGHGYGSVAALDADDYDLALLWFARALDLDRDDPVRAPAHRLRLANTWRQMPRLVGVYPHGATVSHAA